MFEHKDFYSDHISLFSVSIFSPREQQCYYARTSRSQSLFRTTISSTNIDVKNE